MNEGAKAAGWLVVGVIGIGWVASSWLGCGDGEDEDLLGEQACGMYAGIADDASAGVLTPVELREQLKGVYQKARYADTPAVAQGAQGMLAAATSDDGDEMKAAIGTFVAGCNSIAPD